MSDCLGKKIRNTYYNPQALHNNSSSTDLLHKGVVVVLQLLQIGAFPSAGEPLIGPLLIKQSFFAGRGGEGGRNSGEETREGGRDCDC